AGDRLRTVMSSIMRQRSGLISAIGNLLSEGLGFDTHDPLRQQAITATAPQPPRQRLRSIHPPKQSAQAVVGLTNRILPDRKIEAFTKIAINCCAYSVCMTAIIERRRSPRRRVLKAGKISFHRQWADIECVVRNLSDTGAGLVVAGIDSILPDEFDLTIQASRRICRVVWRSSSRIGICFQ